MSQLAGKALGERAPAPAAGIARSANSRKESLNALSDADNAYLIALMLERGPTRIKGRFDRCPGFR